MGLKGVGFIGVLGFTGFIGLIGFFAGSLGCFRAWQFRSLSCAEASGGVQTAELFLTACSA